MVEKIFPTALILLRSLTLTPAFLISLIASLSAVQAQELEPRSYNNLPVGTRFLLGGYSWSEGGILADV